MKFLFFIVRASAQPLLGLSLCLFASTASAQPQKLAIEIGWSRSQLSKYLGPADNISKKPDGSFTWHYGESIIFFRDNRVMAWSSNRELSKRVEKRYFQERDVSDSDKMKEVGYVNEWKYRKPPSRDSLLDEMLE